MPDTGLLDRSTVTAGVLAAEPSPLVFTDARWVQVTFEVPRQVAMAHMPADATRPVPCYARFFAIEGALQGEPTAMAALFVGGRFRMMPRNILVAAVGGPAVTGTLTNGLSMGDVTITREPGGVMARVQIDGADVAAVALPAMYAIEPSMLRWDPWLGIATQLGEPVLTELTVTPEASAAFLSKAASITPAPALARESPWRQLRSLLTVSACYAEGTLTLGAPQVLQECS